MNVAAQSELPLARTRSAQWAPALAAACALLILAATAEIVLDGAVGHSILIPKQPEIAGWLVGIGAHRSGASTLPRERAEAMLRFASQVAASVVARSGTEPSVLNQA